MLVQQVAVAVPRAAAALRMHDKDLTAFFEGPTHGNHRAPSPWTLDHDQGFACAYGNAIAPRKTPRFRRNPRGKLRPPRSPGVQNGACDAGMAGRMDAIESMRKHRDHPSTAHQRSLHGGYVNATRKATDHGDATQSQRLPQTKGPTRRFRGAPPRSHHRHTGAKFLHARTFHVKHVRRRAHFRERGGVLRMLPRHTPPSPLRHRSEDRSGPNPRLLQSWPVPREYGPRRI